MVHHDKENADYCKANLHLRLQRKRASKNVSVLITLPPATGYSPPLLVCCVVGKEVRLMRKILEDLYFGNIAPYNKQMAANSELRRLVKRAADCESQ